MVWSTGYEDTEKDDVISSDFVSEAISDFGRDDDGDDDFRFYEAPAPLKDVGVPNRDILDPDTLKKEIREFETERPALTRQELLGLANISPYAPNAVTFEQMRNNLVDLPSTRLNAIRMEMGLPQQELKGTGDIPYDRKGFFERAGEKIADELDLNEDEERVAIISGGQVLQPEGTYTVTRENTIQDFIANTINPLSSLMRVDSRTMVPLEGGEKTQLGLLSTPFGTKTSVTPFSELNVGTPEDNGSDPAFIPPKGGAKTGRQRLVPMGTDRYGAAAGMTLNPSMYYTNPFSYSIPVLGRSFGLLGR